MDELRAKYKAASHEERQRLIHEHDCPRVWDFWRKHSSGSKLCPSCLMCGQQSFDRADWAITHLELPDIYICKGCVDKTRTPQSAIEASIPVALLREHWLHAIECNHETKQDMPICACSKVNLGWHPSVGAAVEVWIKHVQEAAR